MARRKPAHPNAARDALLLEIAQRQFRIETLPYLTGWAQHFAVMAAMAESD